MEAIVQKLIARPLDTYSGNDRQDDLYADLETYLLPEAGRHLGPKDRSFAADRLTTLICALNHPAHVTFVVEFMLHKSASDYISLLSHVISAMWDVAVAAAADMMNDDDEGQALPVMKPFADMAPPFHDIIFDGAHFTPEARNIGKVVCGLATIIIRKHSPHGQPFRPVTLRMSQFSWPEKLDAHTQLTEIVEQILQDDNATKEWYSAGIDEPYTGKMRTFMKVFMKDEHNYDRSRVFSQAYDSLYDDETCDIADLFSIVSPDTVCPIIMFFKLLRTNNVCRQTGIPLPPNHLPFCAGVDALACVLHRIVTQRGQNAYAAYHGLCHDFSDSTENSIVIQRCLQWMVRWDHSSFFLPSDAYDELRPFAPTSSISVGILIVDTYRDVVIPRWQPQYKYTGDQSAIWEVRSIAQTFVTYCESLSLFALQHVNLGDVRTAISRVTALQISKAMCQNSEIPFPY